MRELNFEDSSAEVVKASADMSRLQWLDFTRSEALILGWLESALHDQHRSDIMNSMHAPFFEQTDDYEMLILRTMDERAEIIEPKTRSIAFLICESTIISLRDEDDSTLDRLFSRFSQAKKKRPTDVLSLLHSLINEITDVFLRLREPINLRTGEWQQKLLDPNDPFNDWHIIMQAKSSLGRLNTNLQLQQDVLTSWQETTRYEFSSSLVIKYNDLHEHLARVERFSDSIRSDLDSLTQIYFASTGQRTNVNVQFLAVISAIFLPMNLIAGFFGMNFDNIPLLKHPLGAYLVVAGMLFLSGMLLWWFKKKNWY